MYQILDKNEMFDTIKANLEKINASTDRKECNQLYKINQSFDRSIMTEKQQQAIRLREEEVINNKFFQHPSGKSNAECYKEIDDLLEQLHKQYDRTLYLSVVKALKKTEVYASGLTKKQINKLQQRFDGIENNRPFKAKSLMEEMRKKKRIQEHNMKSSIEGLAESVKSTLNLYDFRTLLRKLQDLNNVTYAEAIIDSIYKAHKDEWRDYDDKNLTDYGFKSRPIKKYVLEQSTDILSV